MDFGCKDCRPPDADIAWKARRALAREADLIDESHLHVMILMCRTCSQRFLSVFTETIDWAGGEDPQHWMLLPITDAEAAELVRAEGPVTEAQISAIAPGRRCLRHDNPKAGAPCSSWGVGIRVGPHD